MLPSVIVKLPPVGDPVVRVTVTVWPLTDRLAVPFEIACTFADPTLKPAGKRIATLPLFGHGFAVVKLTTTLPVAPATLDAGVTDADVSAPGVMTLPATLGAVSIAAAPLVWVVTE